MPLQPSRGLLGTTKAVVLGLGVTESVLCEGGESPSQATVIVTTSPAGTRVRRGGRCKGLLTSDPPGIEGVCRSLVRRPRFKSQSIGDQSSFLILMLTVASAIHLTLLLQTSD